MFKGQRLLITGATGLIGRQLVELLKEYNPSRITSLSLDDSQIEGVNCVKVDLRELTSCLEWCEEQDFIFHLAGIKSNPKMCAEKPYSFSVPMVQFNANMIEAFRQSSAKAMLVTSSVGVYSPAELLKEDDVWKTFPSENDKFAGWAKRMLELNAEAYNKQFGDRPISVVRPANVYGEWDNFNPETAMVIPSLIARVCRNENPLVCWSDGSAIRDFINSKDVARGMIFCMTHGITEPVNLGSGEGISIKHLVNYIVDSYKLLTGKTVEVDWDATKPGGDKRRLMDMTKMKNYGFELSVDLSQGILDTMKWYLDNKDILEKRYDVFAK